MQWHNVMGFIFAETTSDAWCASAEITVSARNVHGFKKVHVSLNTETAGSHLNSSLSNVFKQLGDRKHVHTHT